MWDRPSANTPIFASTRPSRPESMMWSRQGPIQPIYEEAVATPAKTQMWRRSGIAAVPMCPCCTEQGGAANKHANAHVHRPGSMDTIASTASSSEEEREAGSGVAAGYHQRPENRRPSAAGSARLGLRLRKSFASLRSRASRSTMRE